MRHDIQCLRAIAIIGVVGFHIFPENLPNGFLGVDVFFVISGFLMSKILYAKSLDVATIADFYYKRIKRIWIIYYLIIFAINLSKQFLQAEIWWPNNNIYAFFSLLFLTNQKIMSDQNDYFNTFKTDVTANNLFLHCWSLSVEVQFYTIVPFVFIGLHQLKSVRLRIFALIIASIISFSITFISIDPNFTFNFAIARFWQFFAGILGHIIASENVISDPKRVSKISEHRAFLRDQLHCTILAGLLILFWPLELSSTPVRLAITCLTAFIIASNISPYTAAIIASPILFYIGNLSYIIYLVHWPLVVFFKQDVTAIHLIYLTAFLSIILHHSFERIIVRQSRRSIGLWLIALLAANASFQFAQFADPELMAFGNSRPYIRAVDENLKLNNYSTTWGNPSCQLQPIDIELDGKLPFGHCKFPPGNGTLKIMLIGNSYTLNQAQTIHKAFRGNFSSFEYVSIIGNFALYENGLYNSAQKLTIAKQIAKRVKPDVIFIVTRFVDVSMAPIRNIETDEVLRQFNENIAFFEAISKKVYIMGAFPFVPYKFLKMFVADLMLEKDGLDRFHMSVRKHKNMMKHLIKRLEHLKCKNCEVYDLGTTLLNDGFYRTFNESSKLLHFDDGIHLTQLALDAFIEPFYRRASTTMNI
ncbi:unnamed protein product [Caenorhabditis bovis]|uniref:Acyl_transf_3 domain-containing protein n=1 Tax=Caenorhabditis bovis TaxID=2654633 RepID=A0A8S1F3Y1_9PELO|nr:unnamed protein product [Caenorhabditis bovis]